MENKARILLVSALVLLALAAPAWAEDASPIGSALIDLNGDVSMSGLSDSMADPVPLFAGDNGPAVFVLQSPSLTGDSETLEDKLMESAKKAFEPPQSRVYLGR
tara:strand:+ start:208083 stop:208394 length:312 start_codon:yes stop_codon:yes gene_type:complete